MSNLKTIREQFQEFNRDEHPGTGIMAPQQLKAEFDKYIDWTPSLSEGCRREMKKLVNIHFKLMSMTIKSFELTVRRIEEECIDNE